MASFPKRVVANCPSETSSRYRPPFLKFQKHTDKRNTPSLLLMVFHLLLAGQSISPRAETPGLPVRPVPAIVNFEISSRVRNGLERPHLRGGTIGFFQRNRRSLVAHWYPRLLTFVSDVVTTASKIPRNRSPNFLRSLRLLCIDENAEQRVCAVGTGPEVHASDQASRCAASTNRRRSRVIGQNRKDSGERPKSCLNTFQIS